jgi:hypothetical protein
MAPVPPGGQDAFAEAQTGEYRRLGFSATGSLSANLHRGLGPDARLANVAQFRDLESYAAWRASDAFREHGEIIRPLFVRAEPGLYRVRHALARPASSVDAAPIEPGRFARIHLAHAEAGDRARLLEAQADAARRLLGRGDGPVSVTLLEGIERPAPAGPPGPGGVRDVSHTLAAYFLCESRATAEALGSDPAFRAAFAEGAGARVVLSEPFEVVFVQSQAAG